MVWVILCVIWGSTWIFIKVGLDDLPPMTFASARFILSAVILFAILRARKVRMPHGRKEWTLIAITGFLQFTINYSTVFWSEQHITSGLAAVLQATIPVFGLMLAWIFLPSEKMTLQKICAVILGIIGVGVIFADQLRVDNVMALIGSVVIVIGSYAAAQSSILVKSKITDLKPEAILFSQILIGMPPVILYSLLVEGDPIKHSWNFVTIGCVIYLALIGTITAFWLYYWLLSRVESTKAMMISLVTPLLAVLLGAAFLNETMPPQTSIGGILILISIGLIVFRKIKLKKIDL